MLLFFFIVLIGFISIFIVFSRIEISFENCQIEFMCGKLNSRIEYKISVYLISKIKIFSYKVVNNLHKNKYNKKKKCMPNNKSDGKIRKWIKNKVDGQIKNNLVVLKKYRRNIKRKIIKGIQNNIKITNLNLDIMIDTKEIMVTTYIVSVISIIFPMLFNKNIIFNKKKDKFNIVALYKGENYFKIDLKCNISTKIFDMIRLFI